jgi:hypothetical protein
VAQELCAISSTLKINLYANKKLGEACFSTPIVANSGKRLLGTGDPEQRLKANSGWAGPLSSSMDVVISFRIALLFVRTQC